MAVGACAQSGCRELLLRRLLAAARNARAALLANAARRRARSAAQRGIPTEEHTSYRLAVLPRNDDRSSRLPARRRARFEQHLRQNLTEARQRLAAGDAGEPRYSEPAFDTPSSATQAAERQLLGAGCGACRGQCCRTGGDHAYNSADTMMQYLQLHTGQDDDTIVSRYLSRIGQRTMTRGCVYQQEDGCSLPRDLRSDVCNRFYCDGLRMIRHQFVDGDPVRAYFVHERDQRLVGGKFVEVPTLPVVR